MSTQYLLDKKRGKGGKERDGEEQNGGGGEWRTEWGGQKSQLVFLLLQIEKHLYYLG